LALTPHPTTVIAFDDTLALQMIRAAHEHGLHVPGDVSIAGFNDAPHAALTVPAITTVHIPMLDAGHQAAEALCRATLKGSALTSISLPCKICWRESTGPAMS
jgi:LacI family transcriptional regulator